VSNTAATGLLADRYRAEGFAVVESVLSADKVALYQEECTRIVTLCSQDIDMHLPRLEFEVDHLSEADRTGMEGVIRKIEPLVDLSDLFTSLAEHPRIVGPATSIFGEPVELFEDKLNLKLPGGSSYPWHQDWSCCWRAHTDQLVTCFVYLDDADESNGCLEVVPGSHSDRRTCPFKDGSHFEVDPKSFDHDAIKPVPLRAGDMIVFDPYLLHFSDVNRSQVPRRTIVYTYNPASLGEVNKARFDVLLSAERMDK
jgi:ectoine hydroxylase-related dioxygenase (phytanoyl-CoA dioxygenase family)